MSENYNAIIIGGGPAGYVAAIRLAQLGKKVLIIEKRSTLGGTCLNVGCIPTKVLLDSTEFYSIAQNHATELGVILDNIKYDLEKIMLRKNKVVDERCNGVDFLIQKNKITRIQGTAKLIGGNSVEVITGNGNDRIKYSSEHIILATGSVPVEIPSIPFNGKNVIHSDDAISLGKVPKELIVIGAGAIGLELGSVWSRLGSKVSIIEMVPNLFGGIDRQIASSAQRLLTMHGLNFFMEHKVEKVTSIENQVTVRAVNKKGESIEIVGDVLLVAAGRKPCLDNLGLENAGVKIKANGKIDVNTQTYQTANPAVYAIGDIIDGPMLAHKAEEEGVVVAEIICGINSHVNYQTIASVVYTSPEVAWVGRGEEQLKSDQVEYNVGRFLFRANARAHALNDVEGMVKILADKQTDEILGVFILGPRASELIAEASFAMKQRATVDDIIHTVHAHPTLSEVFKEAALDVKKRAIHS